MNLTFGFTVAPGRCHVCGGSPSKTPAGEAMPILDLGEDSRTVLRHRLYVCGLCAIAMADRVAPFLGMRVVPEASEDAPEVSRGRLEQLERMERLVANLQIELAGWEP